MKLLFLILAHNQPAHVIDLAATLTGAASDGHALIHFDKNASESDFNKISDAAKENERIRLVRKRIHCRWGDYSLVEAVLNGLREARASGEEYDYVVLLSGACLPCRPVKQLERYLRENYGREFIEARDENWVTAGLRKERYQYYFPFSPSQKPSYREHLMVVAQKKLGVKRGVPEGYEVRFGSQWWTLTWKTCKTILDRFDRHPKLEKFFRKTYIPDEMVFPTLVWNNVSKEHIANFTLTHFQFTNCGKPTVFYDDHSNYPFSLDRFFYRKVSGEAVALRKTSLARAFEPDDGESLAWIGSPNRDYDLKARAQTEFPVPGQMFYRDQFRDSGEGVLRSTEGNYIFVCGEATAVASLLSVTNDSRLFVVGSVFAPDRVGLGDEAGPVQGLRPDDNKIRDLHPLLYLARVRQRCDGGVPVFAWSPKHLKGAMEIVARDPKALIVALPPMADNGYRSRRMMEAASGEPSRNLFSQLPDALLQKASRSAGRAEEVPEPLTAALDGDFRRNIVTVPISADRAAAGRAETIFQRSVEHCSFRHDPWFAPLMTQLQDWADGLRGELIEEAAQ